MDMDADFLTMLADFKAKEAIRRDISDKYKGVVLLNWEEDVDEIFAYGDALKAMADKKIGKSTSLYILGPGHFVYGLIEIINHGDSNYSIKTLYIDSLGTTEGCNGFEGLIDPLTHAFPESTIKEYYCPELKTQHSSVGCSVLVLNDFNKMMYYDWTVRMHQPQYDKVLPSEGAIWAYMKRQDPVSRLGRYYIGGSSDKDREADYQCSQVQSMPFFLSRQKQSMNNSGLTRVYDLDLRLKDANYSGTERVVVGHQGYRIDYQQSPKERQMEASQGFSPFSSETVDEYVKRHLKQNAQGKEQNTVTNEIFTWTRPLLNYLVDKSPEEIKALPEDYTIEGFRAKNGV
jgi:hypothetical protein